MHIETQGGNHKNRKYYLTEGRSKEKVSPDS